MLETVDGEGAAAFSNLLDSVPPSANKVKLNKLEVIGKSIMKIKKGSGSRIEPSGTPQSTERRSDNLLIYCCLFARYDLNQSKATLRTPYTLKSCNKIVWSTQSKSLEKSKNIETTE